MSSAQSKYSIFLLITVSILLLNCAASPKYRSSNSPYAKSSDAPPKRSGNVFEVPDELWEAPSLKTIYGVSSWYGPQFHGNLTANGEVYDMDKNSAAHKELPFNTWIRVTNLKNNYSILTRINDRGPFIKGRELDLSRGAAKELGMLIDGLANVKIEIVRWGPGK